MKDYVPIGAAALSGFVFIVVVFLGAWLGRKNEHARWVREQRLQAYTDWLGVLHELLVLKAELGGLGEKFGSLIRTLDSMAEPLDSDMQGLLRFHEETRKCEARHDELVKELRRVRLLQTSLFNKVQVLASLPLRHEAVVLSEVMHELVDDDDKYASDLRWSDALDVFRGLMRKELRVR
jgi:hypothetical protein